MISARIAPAPATAPTVDGLYRAYAADVARWAVRLGGPRIDADDVVQEVFLVASRQLGHWRGEAHLSTWLFRITDRVVANHRRSAWLRRFWENLTGTPDETPVSTDQWPSAPLERREDAVRLYRILDELPEHQRRVVILFELEEMPTAEIAALLGVRHATVRVWLHRARARLLRRARELCTREAE
jgi:RNA polymerase sigma-70 factor (ECF subfamily)